MSQQQRIRVMTQAEAIELSCEFFPPKTMEGMAKLLNTGKGFSEINPAFFSVTYGAGGSTREKTLETTLAIRNATGIKTAPHLSCIGSTRASIQETLETYRNSGINHIIALRGDLPSGMRDIGEFHYAADLVEFIRNTHGDHFQIDVAAYPEIHPQATSATTDLQFFQKKVEAGANQAITQYFYNADAYLQFVKECREKNIEIPIIPGIMPITQFTQLARFSDACGAEIPRWIRKRLEDNTNDREKILHFGVDIVSDLCQKLLNAGAPGLHFYTMNQIEPTRSILKNLDLWQ